MRVVGGSLNQIATPRVTPGLPSELLTQRPDIRRQEAQLASATANVGNARAQFFPSIQLTGQGGYQSSALTSLFQPHAAFFSMVGSLTQPIFDGGRILGNFEFTKARQDELLQTYRKTVVQSFADVDNALYSIRQTTEKLRLQREVVAASRRAFELSEQQLRAGTADIASCAKYTTDVVPGRGCAVAGPIGQAARDRQSLSSAGGAAGSPGWKGQSMLFKPEAKDDAKTAGRRVARGIGRRMVSLTVMLLILGGLGYLGWNAFQQKQAGRGGPGARPDLPVPVLAATPRMQDVPVYLDAVGSVRALNTVTVRSQVDGKLIKVNFVEGQDVKQNDVLAEIDPVIYQAQYDQAVAKKARG